MQGYQKIVTSIGMLILVFASYAQKPYVMVRHVGYDQYDRPVFNGLYQGNDGEMAGDLFAHEDDGVGVYEMLEEGSAGYVIAYQNQTFVALSEDESQIVISKDGKEQELVFSEDPEIQKKYARSYSLALATMYPFVSLSEDGNSLYMPVDLPANSPDLAIGKKDLQSGEVTMLNVAGTFPVADGNRMHYITYAPGDESGLDVNVLNLETGESQKTPIRLPGGLNILTYKPMLGDGSALVLVNGQLYFFNVNAGRFDRLESPDLLDKRKFVSAYYSRINNQMMYLKMNQAATRYKNEPINIRGFFEYSWDDIQSEK